MSGSDAQTSDVFVSIQIFTLKHGPEEARADAVKNLVERGPMAIEPLIDALEDPNWQNQNRIARVIKHFGEPAVPPMLDRLRTATVTHQIGLCLALGHAGSLSATQPLISLMNSEDAAVREASAQALGMLGRRTMRALVMALRDASWRVRAGAAMALAGLKEKRSLYPLIASLHDPYAQVRAGAARALGELGDNRAVEPLLNALRDSEQLVRSQAAVALGRIGDERAVLSLINTIKNAKPSSVRSNAAVALGLIGSERAIPVLVEALIDDDPNVQAWASGALVRFGKQAVDPLIEALQKDEYATSQRAVRALGGIGDPRAREVLVSLTTKESVGSEIREIAKKLLERLGDPAEEAPDENSPAEDSAPAHEDPTSTD